MKSYIKKMCIVFCIIFSILVSLHYFRGEVVSNSIIKSFLIISAFSSIMTFLLRENEKNSNFQVVLRQVLYIGSVMASLIGITYFSGWEQNVFTIVINFIIVIGIYIFIKGFIFKKDKRDVEEINRALSDRSKNG